MAEGGARESITLKELAYMRRRPIYGRSVRSTSSKAVSNKNQHRQSSYSQMNNDNKSLDFVYFR